MLRIRAHRRPDIGLVSPARRKHGRSAAYSQYDLLILNVDHRSAHLQLPCYVQLAEVTRGERQRLAERLVYVSYNQFTFVEIVAVERLLSEHHTLPIIGNLNIVTCARSGREHLGFAG